MSSVSRAQRILGLFLVIAQAPVIGRAADQARMEGPVPASVSALTVDGALEEAKSHSPEIQKAKAASQEKHWKRFEALGHGFLPRLSISGVHYFATQYTTTALNFGGNILTFPGFYPNTELSLDVNWPIFNGLANVRQLEAASLFADASDQELSRAEFQVSEEARLAFYQALAASQLKEVAEQNVKTLEDHLKQVNIQKRGGVATKYDTLRVEVQLNEARADAMDAEDNASLTRKKLTQILGLEKDERQLEGELPVPDAARVKDLELTAGTEQRSDIQALNMRAEAAGKMETASSLWLVPTIGLQGQYLLYDSQFFNNVVINTGTYKDAYNIGIYLKWNLFDGGVAYAESQEAVYQSTQAEKASRIAKLQVPYDFAYWKRRYVSNTDHYLSKKFDITRSEESVRLAKEEERAGTRTSTETLDAELDLFRARAGVVNAQVNAAEAQIRLELAVGRRI